MSLTIRPMARDEADLQRFADCFEANDDHKDLRLLTWQYLQTPVQVSYVDLAVDDGQVGGIYAVFPSRVKVGPHTAVGVQSLDTLVDKDFRGRGLFKQMAASVYERCAAGDVAFVYGFPNGNSAHGFFNRLGWTALDPVPFLILPLSSRYVLGKLGLPEAVTRLLPDVGLQRRRRRTMASDEEIRVLLFSEPALDAQLDDLWDDFASQIEVAVVRDAAYLRWRLSRPGERYKTLGLFRGGRLQGLVTFAAKAKHGGTVGYVMELLVRPGEDRVAEVLLQEAVADLRRAGADAVLAWNLEHSPTHRAFRAQRFLPLPERLRPIELHFGARRLAAPDDVAVGNRESWYLSYLDSDTV